MAFYEASTKIFNRLGFKIGLPVMKLVWLWCPCRVPVNMKAVWHWSTHQRSEGVPFQNLQGYGESCLALMSLSGYGHDECWLASRSDCPARKRFGLDRLTNEVRAYRSRTFKAMEQAVWPRCPHQATAMMKAVWPWSNHQRSEGVPFQNLQGYGDGCLASRSDCPVRKRFGLDRITNEMKAYRSRTFKAMVQAVWPRCPHQVTAIVNGFYMMGVSKCQDSNLD